VKTGFVIFAHGSRIEGANESVRAVAAEVSRAGGYDLVEAAFLDLAPPDLESAVGDLVRRGAGRIVLIPYFLTLGTHLDRDLPGIVARASRAHNDVPIDVTPPLNGHPALLEILLERARQAQQ
jgi:sirohydrochlorin ferrochelatase